MAANKMQATADDVDAFLAASPLAGDARALCEIMTRLSGEPPVMWGAAIIGFGRCHYRYESGREGEMARLSFSPRAKELVIYLADGFPREPDLMARLGRHRAGQSCLYIKRLADVDSDVLETLLTEALAYVDERYPPT